MMVSTIDHETKRPIETHTLELVVSVEVRQVGYVMWRMMNIGGVKDVSYRETEHEVDPDDLVNVDEETRAALVE
jgi:hypothetical protein